MSGPFLSLESTTLGVLFAFFGRYKFKRLSYALSSSSGLEASKIRMNSVFEVNKPKTKYALWYRILWSRVPNEAQVRRWG